MGGCRATIYSLNSCLGCREKRFLPSEIQVELHDLLKNYRTGRPPEKAFKLIGEDLDTPAFDVATVEELCRSIDSLKLNAVPVVLAHHNLLPQVLQRTALYTEVINGGILRSRLAACKHSVIYCHGHIHDDLIELVMRPGKDADKLVCVSAPEVIDGFSVITIEFGHSGARLGCIVTAMRVQKDGSVSEQEPRRVPFHEGGFAADLIHPRLREVWNSFPKDDFRAGTVFEQLGKEGAKMHTETFSDILLEAEWFRMIDITDRDHDVRYWTVRRRVP